MALAQARILAGSVLGTLAAMGIVVFVVQGPDSDPLGGPPVWLLVAQLVGGLVMHVAIEAIGYRARPVEAGTPVEEAARLGLGAFRSLLMVRMALSELVAIASLAVAFAIGPPDGVLGYLTGAGVSTVLMLVHVWPWQRPIERTRAALERDGAIVPLPGTPGASSGSSVIEEL